MVGDVNIRGVSITVGTDVVLHQPTGTIDGISALYAHPKVFDLGTEVTVRNMICSFVMHRSTDVHPYGFVVVGDQNIPLTANAIESYGSPPEKWRTRVEVQGPFTKDSGGPQKWIYDMKWTPPAGDTRPKEYRLGDPFLCAAIVDGNRYDGHFLTMTIPTDSRAFLLQLIDLNYYYELWAVKIRPNE